MQFFPILVVLFSYSISLNSCFRPSSISHLAPRPLFQSIDSTTDPDLTSTPEGAPKTIAEPLKVVSCERDDLFSVSELCIKNFFGTGGLVPWKIAQTKYLTKEQFRDLSDRYYESEEERKSCGQLLNDMFVAKDGDEIVGFVEVTVRRFGIGENQEECDLRDSNFFYDNGDGFDSKVLRKSMRDTGYSIATRIKNAERLRPVVSNLVVSRQYRRQNVATKLMESVEVCVQAWGYNEVVLQVEEENKGGREFYRKRGYKLLWKDKSCRKFDADGLWLRNVRTTKLCLRKKLRSRVKLPRNPLLTIFGGWGRKKVRNLNMIE